MRTPEELAHVVSILNGVVRPTAEETLEYVLEVEARTEQRRIEAQEQLEEDMLAELSGVSRPRPTAPEGFNKDLKIKTLQGMILTYEKFGASKEVLDQCYARLDELQGRKKK